MSSGYALWFLRESRYLNGARQTIGSSCAVSGTGFLFSRDVLNETDGWPFHLLTEDIQFSIYHILRGRRVAFCEEAVLFDEQPTSFRQSCRQRMRWAKGYLQVFEKYGRELLRGIFRGSWSCFDMTMNIMPAFVLSTASILLNVVAIVWGVFTGHGIRFTIQTLLGCLGSMLLTLLVLGGITAVTEWRHIHAPAWRKLLSVVTFPLFMLTYLPISLAAVFAPVEWKPIVHSVSGEKVRNLSKT